MKLNIHILAESLSEFSPKLWETSDDSAALEGVRWLTTEPQSHNMYLYLTDETSLSKLDETKPYHLVCVGFRETFPQNWTVISVSSKINSLRLFTTIQDIFEQYAQWEKDVLRAIAEHEPIFEILDLCAKYLHNPIALFDSNTALIHKSGIVPQQVSNSIWDEVLEHGYTLLENLTWSQQQEIYNKFNQNSKPFLLNNSYFPNETQVITPLYNENVLIGNIGCVDIVSPFSPGQLFLLEKVQELMQFALKSESEHLHLGDKVDYYIDQLLQGFSIDENTIAYYLKRKGWRLLDDYQLYYFTRSDLSIMDKWARENYLLRINELLPNNSLFPYENGIIAIVHNLDSSDTTSIHKMLDPLLQKWGLNCGISMHFQNFIHVKQAFIQAKAALNNQNRHQGTSIFFFLNHYLDHIIALLDQTTSLTSLCHPKVMELFEKQSHRGIELVETLQAYLLCGKSKSRASQMLHLHRNTLNYRLDNLEDLLGSDLVSDNKNMLFQLLLSCFILTYRQTLESDL